MNKNILKLTMVFFAIFAFNACSDDDEITFTAQTPPDQISFTNEFLSEYLLSVQTASNNAERFTWEAPDFGVPTPITYQLEGSTDFEFTEPVNLVETSNQQASVSVGQLLSLAESAGLDNDPETDNPDTGDLFFRVRAQIGTENADNSPETISEITTLTVTLIATGGPEPLPVLPNLYLVGNATAADWNNNNNNFPLVRDPENENVFSYTGKFLGGDTNEFKLIENRGAWQPQWGIQDGGFETSEDLGGDPGTFQITEGEGYYTLEVDTENKTSSLVAFDESSSATYASVGIIGFGTTGNDDGWSQDIDMTQSTFDPHIWYISEIELFDGEVKFRAEDNWDTNWGSNTEFTGFGDLNGANIPTRAGTYEVWFNDLTGNYSLIPIL
ncbi:SusF/SusE family outer membrane protein [Psychroflexus sp. CAK8W]|uniref:SusF/SusE family outer membrane protein n=1 Tax=Psychroflexus longus TaxID=2873596 RepID=A0ABS7XL90_9FLAO|nr:SusF/SusE family outer membrane protein [Psychroflexus longus]MBZ9778846.1 SusF/SusE family outer membrane protein [Psychroflexus longus]